MNTNEIPTPISDAEMDDARNVALDFTSKYPAPRESENVYVVPLETARQLERDLIQSEARCRELEQKQSELANHVLITDERHEQLLNCERLLAVTEKALLANRESSLAIVNHSSNAYELACKADDLTAILFNELRSAKVKKCTCGEPHISGKVIHRYDGKPCYLK